MAKRAMTPQDFYSIRASSDVQASADGRHIAYMLWINDEEKDKVLTSIRIVGTDTGAPRDFTKGPADSSPRFSPDSRFLAFIRQDDDNSAIFIAPLDGGEPRRLTNLQGGASSIEWSPDGRRIAFSSKTGNFKLPTKREGKEKAEPTVIRHLAYKQDNIGVFDGRRSHIFVVDVETGKTSQITRGDFNDDGPVWSPDGKTIAFVANRERDRFDGGYMRLDIWAVPSKGGTPKRLTRAKGLALSPRYSPDGKLLAYVGHEAGWKPGVNSHVMVIPAKGGVAPKSLTQRADISALSMGWRPGNLLAWKSKTEVLFVASVQGYAPLYKSNLAGRHQVVVDKTGVESFTLLRSGSIAFCAGWLDDPGDVYLLSGNKRTNLSREHDAFRKEISLSKVKSLTHRASDGRKIQTFLLSSPGRASREGILDIHGGPHSMHPMGPKFVYFHSMAAKRTVLLCNPRGSMGYGEEFSSAVVRDWGGADYEDLLGAVDAAAARGYVDKNRMYVSGYSYGGFMTSWIVGHTHRFRAAVVGAPVVNGLSFLGSDIPRWYTEEIGGMPHEVPDEYIKRSPITYVSNVRTPVLIVHRDGDLRCPIGQGEELFAGLKLLGKQAEFVRYPGGSHISGTPFQLVDMFARTIDWFDRHPARD